MTTPTLNYAQLLQNGAYIDGAWVTADAVIAKGNPVGGSVVGRVLNLGAAETHQRFRRRIAPSTGVCYLPGSAVRSPGAGAN